MEANLKVGDQALIVGGVTHTRNVGKTCTVVEFVDPGAVYICQVTGERIRAPGEKVAVVAGPSIVGVRARPGSRIEHLIHGRSLVAVRHLMPLKGDFSPEEQLVKEKSL